MFVLLAREAPIGVIVRRDARKASQLLVWRTETDEITPGQWLGSELNRPSMGLSPNGRWLIYYAEPKGHYYRSEDGWTAISRPPYFTALAIWMLRRSGPVGGLFASNEEAQGRYWNPVDGYDGPEMRAKGCPLSFTAVRGDLEETRWKMDGWRIERELVERLSAMPALTNTEWLAMTATEYVARKRQEKTALRVRTRIRAKAMGGLDLWRVEDEYRRPIRFQLRDLSGNLLTGIKHASWADWDQSGRLVYEVSGSLRTGSWSAATGWSHREIAHIGKGEFEKVETPAWALEW